MSTSAWTLDFPLSALLSLGDTRAAEGFRGDQGLWNSQIAAGNGASQYQQVRSGWDEFATRY